MRTPQKRSGNHNARDRNARADFFQKKMLEGASNRKHPTKNNAAPMAAIFMASLINLELPRGVPANGFDSKRTTAFIDLGKACKSSFQSAEPEPIRPPYLAAYFAATPT